MIDRSFVDATRLLLRIVPRVFETDRLALKGGTAINLYFDDAPRLSVDLDLVFTQHGLEREDALAAINDEIRRAAGALADDGLTVRQARSPEAGETGLVVSDGNAQVKVETNVVFRGTLLPTTRAALSEGASAWLGVDAPAPVLDHTEVFAGKFLAALDRQHPRDLFDVWRRYQQGPIDPGTLSAFVVYLCGHNRPAHEVLDAPTRVLVEDYDRALVGMVRGRVPEFPELVEVRRRLAADILGGLSSSDRKFLAGFFAGEPDWSLLPYPVAQLLPALRWKLRNLEVLRSNRPAGFARQRELLMGLLG